MVSGCRLWSCYPLQERKGKMIFTAKNQKLHPKRYEEAKRWDDVSNALYEAKSALNGSSFAYVGTTDAFDDEKALKIIDSMSDMLNEYKQAVEALDDALREYKKAHAWGYQESMRIVFDEYMKEEYGEKKVQNV